MITQKLIDEDRKDVTETKKKKKKKDKVRMRAVDTDKMVSFNEEKEEELRRHVIAVQTWAGKEFPDIEHHIRA